MGAFNKEKVLVRGLLRALWKLREGSLRGPLASVEMSPYLVPAVPTHERRAGTGRAAHTSPHTAACWPAVDGSPPCRQHHTAIQIFLPRAKQIFLQWQIRVINVRDVSGQRRLSNWRNEAEENNSSCQMNSCEYFLWTQRWRWRLSGVENLPKWFLF